MLLTTAQGQCIRFLIKDDVRLFKGRDSDGVRGIKLEDGDEVISMAILTHVEATPAERSRLSEAGPRDCAARRARSGEGAAEVETDEEGEVAGDLTSERYRRARPPRSSSC